MIKPIPNKEIFTPKIIGMEVGKPYIVTKPSDDGTFELGDHIMLCADGAIKCKEAMGWIIPSEVAEATKGMEVKFDMDRIEQHKQKLLKELAALNTLSAE
jgi:hypothetical protein